MAVERTIFIVKPEDKDPSIDKASPLEIIAKLEDKLEGDGKGEFKRIYASRTPPLSRLCFEQFYEHLKGKWDGLDGMLDYFAGKRIVIFVYEGEEIVQRIKEIAGPTQYADNIGEGTIRELFGNKQMGYKTVVHASDKEGVVHDFCVLQSLGLIPNFNLL